MDFLSKWLMKTAMGFIGNRPDFYIRDYATKWFERGKLTEENLMAIDAAIEAKNAPAVEPEAMPEENLYR